MNWQRLLRPLSLATFLILIATVEIVGVLFSYGSYQEVAKRLDSVSNRIRQLENNLPLAALSQIKIQSEKYAGEVIQLVDMVSQSPPPKIMPPQLFQDNLCDRVSDIITKANNAQITFPRNFYLGFDAYRTTLPPQNITSELGQELEAIFSLMSQLIDSRIFEISAIYRFSSPEEEGTLQISQFSKLRKVFDLCFISDQRALRAVLNFIPKFPHFISIEAMQVISQSSIPPKKHGAGSDPISMEIAATQMKKSEPDTIKPLFEKERLLVTLRIVILLHIEKENLGFSLEHF